MYFAFDVLTRCDFCIVDLYTVREARFHVKRIKEILTSCDLTDSYTGSNMSSLSFVNGIWSGDGNNGRKKPGEGSVDCTPPEYIMPKSKERPLLPLHPNLAENKVSSNHCLYALMIDLNFNLKHYNSEIIPGSLLAI